ncbi:trypsin theta-like [Nylanderia fulva]|uniref:trypsin theta-like n=1 Tax=Nylanderia fulva TaxID=613905 RepID=UPI0010FB231F|nr:trypsin theta-like [Nylanderia fulva]
MNVLAGLIVACLAFNAYGLPRSQIIGGNDAVDGLYPYQVSLRDALKNNTYFCSGAIISAHYVITAAQCLTDTNPYDVKIAVGSNYLDTPSVLYRATIFIVHAGYNKLLNINDIGLIYVSDIITFNENIQPINLVTADQNYDNYPLLITGWGKLWMGGPTPNHLQEIIVKGYSQEECSSFNNIKKTHICTFTMEGEGICHGDAGSPLVADGVLVGLVSYSFGPCGLPISHIIGGKDAPNGLYPYQVSLRNSKNNRHFCGGAIISKRYIITAAHCFNNLNQPSDVLVAVGSNYLDAPRAVYEVAKFIRHDDFDNYLHINDIGLIRVVKNIKFNKNIQPIALPSTDSNYNNRYLVVTGWGRLRAAGPNPNHLQEIRVKGYSQKKCNTHYQNIVKTQICTLTTQGEGMCNGDSGGPLVADDVLVGLVSFGVLPCGSGNPDVFTRVFYYKKWINSFTQGSE